MEWFAPSLLQQQTTFWWRAAGQQKLCLLRSLPRCCGSLGPHSPTHQSIHSFLHFVNKLPSFRNSFKLIDCWFIHFLIPLITVITFIHSLFLFAEWNGMKWSKESCCLHWINKLIQKPALWVIDFQSSSAIIHSNSIPPSAHPLNSITNLSSIH